MNRNWASSISFLFSLGLLALAGPALGEIVPAFNDAVNGIHCRQPIPGADAAARLFLPGSDPLPEPASPAGLGAPSWRAFRDGLWRQGRPGPSRPALKAMREDDERDPYFTALDLRSDLQRERLAGPVSKRVDFYPGGLRPWSEVRYDRLGRRVLERLLDPEGAVRFQRAWTWEGEGFCPARIQEEAPLGIPRREIRIALRPDGLPGVETHRDATGTPSLQRLYRYDGAGRLAFMMETRGAALAGWKWIFRYDGLGRLERRQVQSSDPRQAWRRTEYRWDSLGRPLSRAEYFENLGLEGVELPESDPREGFKYRWRWDWSGSGAEQALLARPFDGEGNENFPILSRLLSLDSEGRLASVQHRNARGAYGRRESWSFDANGELEREERWGRPGEGISQKDWRMDYDSRGNWTRRLELGALEPAERAFDYFAPEAAP